MVKSLQSHMIDGSASAVALEAAEAHGALKRRHVESVIEWARAALGLTLAEVAATVGASQRTVARWLAGEAAPSPEHRAKIEDLAEVRHLLGAVFADHDAALEWAHTSLPALRGRTPVGELARGHLERVLEVLAALESGAYA